MKETVLQKAAAFRGINDLSIRGEIVIFGSTYMANFPFYELINKSMLENAVYNRSIPNMTLAEADAVLEDCVLSIQPSKIFLAFTKQEMQDNDSIGYYRNMVNHIRTALPDASVYLVDFPENGKEKETFRSQLAALCDGKHVFLISLDASAYSESALYKKQFLTLSRSFRRNSFSFSDAFAAASL